jgi:hypothetical protein
MNHRIINTDVEFPDVLLFRTTGDNGEILVTILAYGTVDESEDQSVEENVVFDTVDSAKNFISDYSLESANSWCVANEITL